MTTADFFDTSRENWQDRLAASVDLMRELSQYSDPRELYQVFSRRMSSLFPTSRQLTLSRRGLEPPQFRVTRFNLWHEPVDPFSMTRNYPVHTGGLLAELLYADEPVVVEKLLLSPEDPSYQFLENQKSLLAIPIFDRGVAQHCVVLAREEAQAFPPEQVPELVWMSNLFSRAAQTLQLSQALQANYADAEVEIQAIADLQESLLPTETPQLSGLETAAHYRAAGRAGGDYYDFFPQPDGSLGVLIADVSGHGSAAAVIMAIAHSFAHAGEAPTAHPGLFLTYMNQRLTSRYSGANGSFITAFYAVINPRRRVITYASAGHVPPWLLKTDGKLTNLNRVQRLPLGVGRASDAYAQFEVPFEPGDTVVMVTDGVTEAVDIAGHVFGTERLHLLLKREVTSTSDLLVRILAVLEQFTGDAPQTDDRTVVIVQAAS